MRLKKGSKVEVMSKREAPTGSWWCAEIISGNGHTYSVKYDDMDGAVERVPRKAIRPCPPPVNGLRSWVPGDIVELFDQHSWKLGEVSRVIGGNYFLVRLLGSSRQLRAHVSDIRWRQSWEDNKWIVIQKKLERCNGALANCQTKTREFSPQLPHLVPAENNPTLRSMKKRAYFCLSRRKMRAVEKDEWCQRVTAGYSSQLLGKTDAVASPSKVLGEKYMHAFLNHKVYKMGMDNQEPHAGVGHHFIGSTEPNGAENVSSSVGSCSPSNSLYRSVVHPINFATHDLDGKCDDAESHCSSRREFTLHSQKRHLKQKFIT